ARELIDLARVDPEAAIAHARDECARDAEMSQRAPDEWLQTWYDADEMSEPDRALMQDAARREHSRSRLREALARGFEGYVQDELILTVRTWGFDAGDIRVPTHLWHGELDTLAPPEGARYLARRIPGCSAHFFPDEGHMLTARHAEEILRTVTGTAR